MEMAKVYYDRYKEPELCKRRHHLLVRATKELRPWAT